MDDEYRTYRIEQAHAYLERIRKMGDSCASLQQEVEDARAKAEGVTGIDYSKDMVQVAANDDAMVNAIERIHAVMRAYTVKLSEMLDERKRASDSLNLMDDYTEARALRLRYICNWKWERVCTEMNYSWDGMMSLRRRALCSYWDVMPVSERDQIPKAI